MNLAQAKKAAVEESKQHRGKTIFIDVDEQGDCDITQYFELSCTHAFKNGSEIALPTPQEAVSSHNKTFKITNTTKQSIMKTTKKSSAKESAKETKESAKAAAPAKAAKGKEKEAPKKSESKAKEKEAIGTTKDITVKELIELLKKGVKVTTATGTPHSLAYCQAVTDKTKTRTVVIHK